MALSSLDLTHASYAFCSLDSYEGFERLPYSQIILLENIVRRYGEGSLAAQALIDTVLQGEKTQEIEFMPARVLLTDFTGVPCMVDFAAMRDAIKGMGGKASRVNPLIQADLVIDHSVIADKSGCKAAAEENSRIEFERNKERYTFLKWAQKSFKNLRIVPPDMGICHQINLEKLSHGIYVLPAREITELQLHRSFDTQGLDLVYPDSLIGADSHTTTVNGIGVCGWGVGGIEAEAALLGQPVSILIPQTVGVKLVGKLPEGVGAMDLALSLAELLRSKAVVGKFVECFGEGLSSLSANDRATVANMSPEYGCTMTFFPFDEETLRYYRVSGRTEAQVELIEAYAKRQHLWHNPQEERVYYELIEFDLSQLTPTLAGPSRPHDKIERAQAQNILRELVAKRGLDKGKSVEISCDSSRFKLTHGAIAIAAITSCTTTANPRLILTAGLLAKAACEKGLSAKPWIKRMWSPGSGVSELIMQESGLQKYFEELGFYTAGFGCMSCIGNSGPLSLEMQLAGKEIELAAVLSGNRNFEGRIGPDISQNYLCSPAQVIAYSLVGTLDFDFEQEALGSFEGKEIYLRDLMPSHEELDELMHKIITPRLFARAQEGLFEGTQAWQELACTASETYLWQENSTYVKKPPYFERCSEELPELFCLRRAKVLIKAGDFITTDHISPAGSIAQESPAADYLRRNSVADTDFNTYGSRRGNHEVMMRGTFANIKMKNELAAPLTGGYTACLIDESFNNRSLVDAELTTVWSAACRYAQAQRDLMVLAGKMYGSGSSRDWAAKGPKLLGIKAVCAVSFERIHRSNLIGMGIVPLQFLEGEDVESLGLSGEESFELDDIDFSVGPYPRQVEVRCVKEDGSTQTFSCLARVDTQTEGLYLRHGGILPYMLRNLLREKEA